MQQFQFNITSILNKNLSILLSCRFCLSVPQYDPKNGTHKFFRLLKKADIGKVFEYSKKQIMINKQSKQFKKFVMSFANEGEWWIFVESSEWNLENYVTKLVRYVLATSLFWTWNWHLYTLLYKRSMNSDGWQTRYDDLEERFNIFSPKIAKGIFQKF